MQCAVGAFCVGEAFPERNYRAGIMKEKGIRFIDITAWVLTAVLFASIFIFGTYAWGRYVLILLSAAIFLLSLVKNGKKAFYAPRPWHFFMLAIAAFSLISSLWAIDPSDSFQKAVTIMGICACFSLPYSYYCRCDDGVRRLIDAVKWGGYAIAFYTFFYYGFGTVFTSLATSDRLKNGFSNVNTIGMITAMSVVIGIYEIKLKKKFTVDAVMAIPAIAVALATQSRKAILLLVAGIFSVLIFSNDPKKSIRKILPKAAIAAAVLIGVGVILLQLPAFSGIKVRIDYMLSALVGKGEAGSSAVIRIEMIKIGLGSFLRHPIGGVGIGCAHFLVNAELLLDTYMHNNYIEILTGGGIIGFAIFYSLYGYLITKFVLNRNAFEPFKNLCIIITILLLLMDVGLVSYYSKDLYFMLMILFLEVGKLDRMRSGETKEKRDEGIVK